MNDLGETYKHTIAQKKPDLKKYILCISIYIKFFLKGAKLLYGVRSQESGGGLWGGRRGSTWRRNEEGFWDVSKALFPDLGRFTL